jgi:hypothetical protein
MVGSFELKLQRAREHFGAYREALQWWFEGQPYRIEEQIDTEADRKEIVVIADEQPPARLSLMLGDAIQNFRSALDYLVGDLARKNSNGVLDDKIERKLQFPITTSRDNFRSEAGRSGKRKGRLSLVPLTAAAHIQRVQPYLRGEEALGVSLRILQELSNVDKHRRLPLLLSVVESIDFSEAVLGPARDRGIGLPGPFEGKAVLVWCVPADSQMDVDLSSVRVGVALGEGLPASGGDPIAVFTSITSQILYGVVDPLAAYL